MHIAALLRLEAPAGLVGCRCLGRTGVFVDAAAEKSRLPAGLVNKTELPVPDRRRALRFPPADGA